MIRRAWAWLTRSRVDIRAFPRNLDDQAGPWVIQWRRWGCWWVIHRTKDKATMDEIMTAVVTGAKKEGIGVRIDARTMM